MDQKILEKLHAVLLLMKDDLWALSSGDIYESPAYDRAMEKLDTIIDIVEHHLSSSSSRAAEADKQPICSADRNPPPA